MPNPSMKEHWDKSGLAAFKKTLSAERLAEDEKKLSTLFNAAAKSPELKDALDWAKDHGVEFIVDRGMGAAGMYHTGTGVLAVAEDLFKPEMREEAVVTLAHEIRHAWQDYNNLLPTFPTSFTGFYIRQSLMEADAEAHGRLAGEQWYMNSLLQPTGSDGGPRRDVPEEYKEDIRQALEELKKDPSGLLWEEFNHWYNSGAPEAYGYMTMRGIAEELGIPGTEDLADENPIIAEADKVPEFDPMLYMRSMPAPNPGISIRNENSLAALGKGFKDDNNYFEAAPEGAIERKILNPRLAASFYKAGERPHPLVQEILLIEREWAEEEQRRKRRGWGFGFGRTAQQQPAAPTGG